MAHFTALRICGVGTEKLGGCQYGALTIAHGSFAVAASNRNSDEAIINTLIIYDK